MCSTPDCMTELKKLGYSKQAREKLCPSATLNGKICESPGYISECAGNEDEEAYMQTADCSNIEPCATSSCKKIVSLPRGYTLEDILARSLYIYPQCPGDEKT